MEDGFADEAGIILQHSKAREETVMPRVKEVYMDNENRANMILWDDGSIEEIPFTVHETLQDHGGDRQSYWNSVNREIEKYAQTVSRLRPGEPNPMDRQYPQGQYDPRYESDLRVFEIKQAQRELAEENAPPPPPPISFPRDEHKAERIGLYEEVHKWEDKLAQAERMGDKEAAHRAKEFIRGAKKDLGDIPESKFQTDGKKLIEKEVIALVGAMFDPSLKDHPMWNNPNVQHNAALALRDFNERVGGTSVVLPRETSKASRKYMPLKPGNVVEVELGDQKAKQNFCNTVYTCGADPHDFVRGSGYGHYLKTADEEVPEEKEEVKPRDNQDPEQMTQKEWVTWRTTGKKPEPVEEEAEPEAPPEKTFEESLVPYQK